MVNNVGFILDELLAGRIAGLAVCAMSDEGEPTALYINASEEDVLREPIERLKVMYELNREMGKADTSPRNNRSYRSH